jgi:multidrug efflux system membrane fusion protein
VIIVLLVALMVIHLLTGQKAKTGQPPQVVSAATATLGDMPEILTALGTVTPVATVNVLPQLSGYLTAVGYQEGQDVAKGQFLAQIDSRQYEINKQQAEAQLAKDQATLEQARTDLARYTQLHEQKSIAEQTYTDQKFTVAQTEAAVKADKAAIAQAELNLAYCHITAPVAGRVGLRLVDPGNYVTQSTSPGIVTITQMKPTTVQFTVPQNSLGKVLQRVNAGAKLPVTAFNSDNSKQIASGTLYALSNQMATSTGTVTLRATFANDDEALFPNEFVNVRIAGRYATEGGTGAHTCRSERRTGRLRLPGQRRPDGIGAQGDAWPQRRPVHCDPGRFGRRTTGSDGRHGPPERWCKNPRRTGASRQRQQYGCTGCRARWQAPTHQLCHYILVSGGRASR